VVSLTIHSYLFYLQEDTFQTLIGICGNFQHEVILAVLYIKLFQTDSPQLEKIGKTGEPLLSKIAIHPNVFIYTEDLITLIFRSC